jgi:DNA invertase Pin-like site-specific DNA recombinase
MKNAVALIRVSTRNQFNNGGSVEDQEVQIRQYASEAGLNICEVVKIQQSGSKQVLNVGQLSETINRAKELGCAICVTRTDRLSRDTISLLMLKKASAESGVEIHVTTLKRTINEISDLEWTLMSVMAEQERNTIIARAKRACRNNVGPIGKEISIEMMNKRSAEKRRSLAQNWAQSVRLRQHIEEAITQLKVPNLKNTARWLNGEGVLTRRGGKWTGSNLHSQIQRLNWNWRELAKSC